MPEIDHTHDRLRLLLDATNAILRESADRLSGAFNPADLRCCDSQRVTSVTGDSWLRVVIEEASPDETALQKFVQSRLESEGFKDVEIITQW